MKREYLKNFNQGFKEIKKPVKANLDTLIAETLQALKDAPPHQYQAGVQLEKLHNYIASRKAFGALPKALSAQIFKYFFERDLADLKNIHNRDKYVQQILKATYIKLENYSLDWRKIIAQFEDSPVEASKLSGLYSFGVMLRKYYDKNNALEVLEYFRGQYDLGSSMTWMYLEQYVNITRETDPAIATKFLEEIYNLMDIKGVKDLHTWRWVLRIKKRLPSLPVATLLPQLNDSLIHKFLLIQNRQKSTQLLSCRLLGQYLASMLGKNNPRSIELIQRFFEIFNNALVALHQAKNPIRLLSSFMTAFSKRVRHEKEIKDKLTKLQQTGGEQEQEEDEVAKEEDSEEEKDEEKETQTLLAGQLVINNLQGNDSDDELEQREEGEQPETKDPQYKINRLKFALGDELPAEIITELKVQLKAKLHDFFLMQTREASKILRATFCLFPELTTEALPMIAKGVLVPELSVPVLMKNTKKVVQYLLAYGERDALLGRILNIIESILKIRYVKEGWSVIHYIVSKIPVLDEKDYLAVDPAVKETFQKHFLMGHDSFYERYSEYVFAAFERLLKQTEAKQQANYTFIDNPFLPVAYNSHKYFLKRCVNHACEKYLEWRSPYILSFLYHTGVPATDIDDFVTLDLKNYKGEQQERRINQLVIVCASASFEQFKEYLEAIGQVDSQYAIASVTNAVHRFCYRRLETTMLYQALPSSLAFLYGEGSLEAYLANPDQKKNHQSIKEFMSLWDFYYDGLLKDVETRLDGAKDKLVSDPLQIIANMNFETYPIDFGFRKNLLWKLQVLENIAREIPFKKRIAAKLPYVKDLYFQDFEEIAGMKDRFISLLEKLFSVAYSLNCQDHRLLEALSCSAVSIIDHQENTFHTQKAQIKDVSKIQKMGEPEGFVDHLVSIYQIECKLEELNHSVIFEHSNAKNEALNQHLLTFIMHPDENESFISGRRFEISPTPLLLRLVAYQPDASVPVEKVKKFHIKIAKVIKVIVTKTKINLPFEELLAIFEACAKHVDSPQRTIRQAYLAALKALIVNICEQRASLAYLEEKTTKALETNKDPKQQLLWGLLLSLIATHHPENLDCSKFYPFFEPLVFSEHFICRKFGLYVVGSLMHKHHKLADVKEQLQGLPPYKEKGLWDFLETGYLHPEHLRLTIDKKRYLRDTKPYDSCTLLKRAQFEPYFTFLGDSSKCQALMHNYQLDQYNSEQEAMAARRSFKEVTELTDLFSSLFLAFNERVVLCRHEYSAYERFVGEKYFKEILGADQTSGLRFFRATKGFVTECLDKLQLMDSQIVVLNYFDGLFLRYFETRDTLPAADEAELQEFFTHFFKKVIENSAGAFFSFFEKIVRSRGYLGGPYKGSYLQKLFESYQPTQPNYFRAVELLSIIHGNNYLGLCALFDRIVAACANSTVAELNLENPVFIKLVKSIIRYPENHPINSTIASNSKILNFEGLKSQGRLQHEIGEFYVCKREANFDDRLLGLIQKLLKSEAIVDRKVGASLLFDSLKTYIRLRKTHDNTVVVVGLLKVAVEWFVNNKEEVKTEVSHITSTLQLVFTQRFTPSDFKLVLESVLPLLRPVAETAQFLSMHKHPYNFMFQDQGDYQSLVLHLTKLLDNPQLYRDVLLAISGLFYYRKVDTKVVEAIAKDERQRVIMFQALMLADPKNIRAYEPQLEVVLSFKDKEKVKAWAKLMLDSRGKAELIDEEESMETWKKIKQFSNPYHYHA